MMHGWGMGMGGFGMGLPFFGVLPLILIGGGIYVLIRLRQNRTTRDDRGVGAPRGTPAPEIFRLAKRKGGILTVSDVVSELNFDPKEAEAHLDGLTDGQRVDMHVDDDGVVRYVFREFTSGAP
ncbi:MAG: hypothetical protein WD492_16755 [Alkalispirochaeta sp.]